MSELLTTNSAMDIPHNLLSSFDSEISRLSSIEFDRLMNLPDKVIREYENGCQISASFHQYGMYPNSSDEGPVDMRFRIFAGNQNAQVGKDAAYAGELEYQLKFTRNSAVKIEPRQIHIQKKWFGDWLRENLPDAISDILEANEKAYFAEEEFRESIAQIKKVELKTSLRDLVGLVLGAIIGGVGIHNLLGIGFITMFVSIAAGYAGSLFVREAFPVEGESIKHKKNIDMDDA